MSKKELVELVDMGKVVLVLTGTEGRYDRGILNEAYGATPFGVIGRRGINILMAAYLSDLEKRYSDHFPGVYEISKELYRSARRESDKNLLLAADLMSFPRLAKAKSFVHLNNDGLLSLSAFGVNTIVGDMLTAGNDGAESGNLDLLLAASMGPVHLAMALNAAYLPNSCSGTGIPGIGMSPDVRLADIMETNSLIYRDRDTSESWTAWNCSSATGVFRFLMWREVLMIGILRRCSGSFWMESRSFQSKHRMKKSGSTTICCSKLQSCRTAPR